MAKKAPDAFRTISEVSDALDTPAHVLRFWESKFSQIKPVKRAGGRRYYRPQDIALLTGIKTLLHEQGMTIKGTQKLLREKGVKHVAALATSPIDAQAEAVKPAPTRLKAETEDAVVLEAVAVAPKTQEPKAPVDAGPRIMDLIAGARGQNLPADKIAPLVTRLEAVRDRIRAA